MVPGPDIESVDEYSLENSSYIIEGSVIINGNNCVLLTINTPTPGEQGNKQTKCCGARTFSTVGGPKRSADSKESNVLSPSGRGRDVNCSN